ncbi:MAG: 2-oxoacid:acceptor oxidoreductase family protein [Thermodesulfobacteriota bacterium]|nr:MAG: 2-oxoacid:acceptor oxidoreductase family protein [Thermodesulfobacteriota bacterium]
MSERYEIRFSGSGGQGMILAGIIMAEAAGIYGDKFSAQSQSYGPESRGGASKAEVIISDEMIDYPKATAIDCMLAMTQEACTKYHGDVKDSGILLVDSDEVKELPEGKFRLLGFPIIETARKELGKTIVANIISLGMITELTGIVSHENIEKAVLSRVPPAFLDLNKKALQLGFEKAKDLK